jgi:hypothetical protein
MTNIVKLSSDYKREREEKEEEKEEKEEKKEKKVKVPVKEKTKEKTEELFNDYISCADDLNNKQCNEILITILQKMEIM